MWRPVEVHGYVLTRRRIQSTQTPRSNYQFVGNRRLEADRMEQGTCCSDREIQVRESCAHSDTCLVILKGCWSIVSRILWKFGLMRTKNTWKSFAYTHALKSKTPPITPPAEMGAREVEIWNKEQSPCLALPVPGLTAAEHQPKLVRGHWHTLSLRPWTHAVPNMRVEEHTKTCPTLELACQALNPRQ